MEAPCYTEAAQDLGLREPFGMTVPTSALHKDASPECSFLTSVDLQSLLQQRSSFDNLDVCQLASSPDSLFSPRGSLSLPTPGENNLFAELFPGSLLFPSPTSLPSPATDELAPAPVPAPLPARLPTKIFEHMPAATLDANAASTLPAARNLLQRLDSCVSQGGEAQPEQRHSPKRRRTSAYRGCSSYVLLGDDAECEGEDAEMGDAMAGCASDLDASCGGYGFAYGSASQHEDGLAGSHSLSLGSDDEEDGEDAKLESKRARNREAARRMRQRQRQQISKLEAEVGNQYDTIQGLLGKLSVLAKEMKCTAKENDLLKQLLNSAATQATTDAGCEDLLASAAAMPLGLLPPGLDSAASGSQGLLGCAFPLLPASSSLAPTTQDPEASLLMPAKGSGAHAAVVAASGAVPSCAPPGSCPASPLPPSPFASPKRPLAPRSPSKPLTPQRLALRSPFAAAPQERGPSRLSMLSGPAAGGAALPAAVAPAPTCPSSKALLLEQLAAGAAPLQQAVAQALLRRLQQQQEAELCGQGPAWAPEEQVSDEEAAQIAAMALQHSLGNVSAAVLQLLSWGTLSEECKAVA